DPEKRKYKYMITEVAVEVLPVTNYSSTLQVNDKDGKAEVVWKGAFYRGYPNNNPPDELNDEAAIAAVEAIYQVGVDALAEQFAKAEETMQRVLVFITRRARPLVAAMVLSFTPAFAGDLAFITSQNGNAVSVIDLTTRKIIAQSAVEGAPAPVAY